MDALREEFYSGLPSWMLIVVIVLMLCSLLTANPALTAFAVSQPFFYLWLLWRRIEPPALLYICCFQWVESSIAVFYTDVYSTPLEFATHAEFVRATWLAMIGTTCFTLGIRMALIGMHRSFGKAAVVEVEELSIPKLFNGYVVFFGILFLLRYLADWIPALQQPLLALTGLKWVFVFLLMFAVIRQKRYYGLLAVIVVTETVVGLASFFSHFRDVYQLLGVVMLCSPRALHMRRVLLISCLVVMLFLMGGIWSAIKEEYRGYLNQGTEQQVALVSVPQRFAKLEQLLVDIDGDKLQDGIQRLVLRVSYVEYFALCIMNVPLNIPHENGKLWWSAIDNILTPRFLNPEKAAINDSDRTSYYTGINVAGVESGTSIGIGYMGESYIDFGPYFMFVPIFLLGLVAGLVYRYFVEKTFNRLFGMAIATTILLFGGFAIEQSNIKLVGGLVMSFLVLWMFQKILGRAFWKSMQQNKMYSGKKTPFRQ